MLSWIRPLGWNEHDFSPRAMLGTELVQGNEYSCFSTGLSDRRRHFLSHFYPDGFQQILKTRVGAKPVEVRFVMLGRNWFDFSASAFKRNSMAFSLSPAAAFPRASKMFGMNCRVDFS